MEKKNLAPVWSLVSVLVTTFFLLADLFVVAVMPTAIILLIVFSVLSLVGMAATLVFRGKQKEKERRELNDRFEHIFKTEKAMFLLIKKTEDQFSSLDRKLGDSIEEVIKTQKAAAKVMINRSRENADAIMNSNDKVMERFLDYEEKLDQNNELIGAQKASAEENFGKIVEKQTEIAASVDNLLTSVKKEMDQLADRLESSIKTAAEHTAAPSMASFGIHEPEYRVQVDTPAAMKTSVANEFMAVPETAPEPEPQPEPLPAFDASEPLPELGAAEEPLPELDMSEPLPDLGAVEEPLPELDMSEPLPDLGAAEEPLPELDMSEPLPDLGAVEEPLPDLDMSEPLPDLGATEEPLPDLGAAEESLPDLDMSEPLPDLGTESLPDLGATEPLPDLDMSEPLPDLGAAEEPLPDLDMSEPLPDLDAVEPEKSPLDDMGLFDDSLNLNFDGIEGFGDELKAVNEELHPEQAQAEEVPNVDSGIGDLSGLDNGMDVFPTVDDGTEAPPVVDEEIINGEPVIEDILPEQKEPEPKPPAPDLSNPNKLMTPEEIAALIASM